MPNENQSGYPLMVIPPRRGSPIYPSDRQVSPRAQLEKSRPFKARAVVGPEQRSSEDHTKGKSLDSSSSCSAPSLTCYGKSSAALLLSNDIATISPESRRATG
ncbi:hypothetical protein Q3G72_031936 [Acer saccharum]|nr:hypothetical protein Q3G72_031936 [Acer saccharum]